MKNIITTIMGDKKEYKQFKNRVAELPTSYKTAFNALEKYMWNFAGGSGFMKVLNAALDIFEEAAGDQVALNDVLGNDPVAFADGLMAQYPDELWLRKQQNNLRAAIAEIKA